MIEDDNDPSRWHFMWVRVSGPSDCAPVAALILYALWWRWGIRTHQIEDETAPEQVIVEVWRPDAGPHIGQPASACPVCVARIEEQDRRTDAGYPPTGMVAEPKEARPSPLLP